MNRTGLVFTLISAILLILSACNGNDIQSPQIVTGPEEIDNKAEELIQDALKKILDQGNLSDSVDIRDPVIITALYQKNSLHPLWFTKGKFFPQADSLISLIRQARWFGLFPEDYYLSALDTARIHLATESEKLDAAKWAYTDLLMTSAFIRMVKDIKVGRLLPDSVLLKDTTLNGEFFAEQLKLFTGKSTLEFATALEPSLHGYQLLKKGLINFLAKANFKSHTLVKSKDNLTLRKLLYKRLSEEDSLHLPQIANPDSTTVANAIRDYQQFNKLKVDGKASSALIRKLNETDNEKFIRVAITLDKYKMLPKMPDEYIWVNLPSFYLRVIEKDSTVLTSRIICGKPTTSTPLLTSSITDMITYPQWTIPASIIKTEILPALKRDAGYLGRKGYSLVDSKGDVISPYSVDWSQYSSGIPFKVVQGSGDANALGVLKFNFPNKYSVYLHDTNQRYLFSNSNRALSHGCVRVQEWRKLAYYLLRRDSAYSPKAVKADSLDSWLGKKMKRSIPVYKKTPLFIRYFGVEHKDQSLVFYDDIYNEDRRLRDQFFSGK